MFLKSLFSHKMLIFLALAFASGLSVALVAARYIHVGYLLYVFLVWNLFLAWLPLLFAWFAYLGQGRRLLFIIFGLLWLLFLPNAPYLVTDLMHLRPWPDVPIWYDLMMLFSFALTGLMLGFLSLYLMQTAVARRYGGLIGWLFVTIALGLSGFGVYIGRFLRWNSWDVFTNPLYLLSDIAHTIFDPQLTLRTVAISSLLSVILLFTYVFLFSLPRLQLDVNRES